MLLFIALGIIAATALWFMTRNFKLWVNIVVGVILLLIDLIREDM
jgi:hypothetical protein